jgi:hypothetical protein
MRVTNKEQKGKRQIKAVPNGLRKPKTQNGGICFLHFAVSPQKMMQISKTTAKFVFASVATNGRSRQN